MSLTIVGLGPGDPDDLTRRAWRTLAEVDEIYLRTRRHPTVEHLPEGPEIHSFDSVYEGEDDFDAVYDTIAARLIELAAEQGRNVVYAVPGDPLVAEGTVTRLLALGAQRGIPVEIVSGLSFVEPALAALGVDALPGLQLVDATDLAPAHHPPINPDYPALVAQVYSRQVASDVKLTLMNQYPDEHPVALIHAAGTGQQRVERLALYEIDRGPVDHLTSLYVWPYRLSTHAATSFEGFQETIAHLRAPEGCPWDREQTHQTLRKHLMEEAFEVIDAIDSGEPARLREELGDLLLQIVLHTQIAVEEGEFNMAEVIHQIDAKLKRRHPHVWGEVDVHGNPSEVTANWAAIKEQEREEKGEGERSALDGVPRAMPALAQAHEYDVRAVQLGFDWPDESGVIEKVQEEIEELKAAETDAERFHEIGDLLLVTAVWSRWLGINPEDALRAANRRFYERFSYIERKAHEQGRSVMDMSLDEMDVLWEEIKAQKRSGE
ncbi:MAG TPA: nucleoside triphosphate pyrophosphohydrolase [Aggregatilineales bacterium]|nr:nucleoside triphosphate pyrophosphohydrolase [Aggregatilineales bacterium]